MTASLLGKQPRPTFLSLAVFVFVVHLLITFLMWLGSPESDVETTGLVAMALLFPLYFLQTYVDFSSDTLAAVAVIFFWPFSALVWSVLVAGLVATLQRLRIKSSNQTLQPTAGRSDD
jgi:hypothetical protein